MCVYCTIGLLLYGQQSMILLVRLKVCNYLLLGESGHYLYTLRLEQNKNM